MACEKYRPLIAMQIASKDRYRDFRLIISPPQVCLDVYGIN